MTDAKLENVLSKSEFQTWIDLTKRMMTVIAERSLIGTVLRGLIEAMEARMKLIDDLSGNKSEEEGRAKPSIH